MQNGNLHSYLTNIFKMKQHFGFSVTEIENLMPWERDMYIDMVNAEIEKQNKENSGH